MSFLKFLKRYENQPTDFGLFASEVGFKRGCRKPRGNHTTIGQWHGYLKRHFLFEGAREVFDRMWEEYQKEIDDEIN